MSALTVETEALNPTKDFSNTKLIKNVKKRTNRVVVGGFRVAFILSNVASASEDNGLLNIGNSAGSGMKTIHQDRTVKMEKILYGINEADIQAITDQAYNDFVQKLQASGLEVLPASTFLNSPQFAEIDQTPAPYKKIPVGSAPTTFTFTAPPLYHSGSDTSMPTAMETKAHSAWATGKRSINSQEITTSLCSFHN